ncbi:hypothetical protein QQ045_028251 [Rhodiola kirilowii]
MPARGAMESITLAHDLTCHINKEHAGGNVIMKIDMAKAYDRVSWLFLIRVMKALGFNDRWCDLVYRSISNCYYSVLWDGNPFGRFKSNRGVRQGDPLSPSLFTICMESLSCLLHKRINAGMIQPYFVSTNALQVHHLLYADDLLIFSNGSNRSIDNMMSLLNSFCSWTDQAINKEKSNIFLPSNMTVTGRVLCEYFQDLEDKIHTRISGWLRNMLTLGGRLVLVESVLNSMAIHILASLPTPASVLDRISSLLANFVWDSGGQSRRR